MDKCIYIKKKEENNKEMEGVNLLTPNRGETLPASKKRDQFFEMLKNGGRSENEPILEFDRSKFSEHERKLIDRLILEFKEEFEDGQIYPKDDVMVFFNQLVDDHFSGFENLESIDFIDLFPNSIIGFSEYEIHYTKFSKPTEEELMERFMELPVKEKIDPEILNASEEEKYKWLDSTLRKEFDSSYSFPEEEIREFIVDCMRSVELLRYKDMLYSDRRITRFVCPDIVQDEEDPSLVYIKQSETHCDTLSVSNDNLYQNETKCQKSPKKGIVEVEEFIERLKDFQFPRKIRLTENKKPDAVPILQNVLKHLGYENGDQMDWVESWNILNAISIVGYKGRYGTTGKAEWDNTCFYLSFRKGSYLTVENLDFIQEAS